MPHLRGVTVHVIDSHGKNLHEWGIQYLRQHDEGKRVSAYVQSETDVSFQISLQPDIPFIAHVPSSDTSGGANNPPMREKSRRTKVGLEDHSLDRDHKKMSANSLSSPVRPPTRSKNHSAPDFAFLAVLYLDGRRKPERKISKSCFRSFFALLRLLFGSSDVPKTGRTIKLYLPRDMLTPNHQVVYTDPADKDFNSPDGKVLFKHRWVQSANGKMTEHAWVFKEKAIETVFDKLMIAGSQASIVDQDDDALIKAMESSGLDARGGTESEGKVGQIVVELQRVILGERRKEGNYRSHHQEGQDEDIDMEGVRRDITHATGFIRKNTLKPQPLRVVDYWPYKPNEGLYATFQFFYRSREQLQQFQFPGFPPLPTITTVGTTRLLRARMADLTPLSISRPLDQKIKQIPRTQDSYEAKVKKRGFKPDDSQKHDFGSEYRDIRPTSPSAVDETYEGKKSLKCPATPLPFPANKQFENTKLDPVSLKIGPTSAEASFSADHAMGSDPNCNLQSQEHARQSFNSDTPPSITAEPSSLLPSSIDFTKEQMAKITDKNIYRPTAGESYSSDQETDADEEHAMESDLETHAGDDDLNYAANPDDEDEGYDSLQSQFKSIKIRKRQRDEVEDAEDYNEAWQGADAAHLDGDGNQKTLKLPLAEEEPAHRGKKSRTAKIKSAADGGQAALGTEKT